MHRVFNFSAGPAALPEAVLKQAQEELLDWRGSGMSVMEMSHRSDEFTSIAEQAETDLRQLLAVPDNYRILFLQGGATGQFSAIPMNLLGKRRACGLIHSGHWAKKALAEAQHYCQVEVIASSEQRNFSYAPAQAELDLSRADEFAYVHYTPNETIGGVAFDYIPEVGDVPLVADASSMLLSGPLDVSRFGLIYAGAQKNIGPAGLTLVIVRDDLLDRAAASTPGVWNYSALAAQGSMLNTPPTYAWYLAGLVFQWLKQQGGLKAMAEVNKCKAEKLYHFIDQSHFYHNPVSIESRSLMNIPFSLVRDELDKTFLQEANAAGLVNLKGHRSVGGMRASIYNAVPEAAVDTLIEFMQQFADQHA